VNQSKHQNLFGIFRSQYSLINYDA